MPRGSVEAAEPGEPVDATRVLAEPGAGPAGLPAPAGLCGPDPGPCPGPARVPPGGALPAPPAEAAGALADAGPFPVVAVTGLALATRAPARTSPAAITSSSHPGAGMCSIVASASANTPAASSRTRGSRTTSGEGSSGPLAPRAAPFTAKASAPVTKTIPTQSVTPAPVARASRTAIAGTEAIESAAA